MNKLDIVTIGWGSVFVASCIYIILKIEGII